jgi:hypothetical protein
VNRDHVGIRRLAAKRDQQESNGWEASVTLKNFGTRTRSVRLETRYAGTQFAPRALVLAPGQESAAEYRFMTNAAGELISHITPADVLPTDQDVHLRLPKSGALEVTVYTARPQELRPLLEADHRLAAHFYAPAAYLAGQQGEVVVLDGFIPRVRPSAPSLWINPPRDGSPIAVKGLDNDGVIKAWHNETILAAGLRSKEAHIKNAEVFETFEGDIPVASTDAGPIVVAHDAGAQNPRFGVIGFDPLQGQLKFEVTPPILFANFLRWLSPESFSTLDLSAGSVGTATIVLDPKERTDHMQVVDDRGLVLPFTVRGGTLQLFTAEPSVLHVDSPERERVVSLTLPDVAEAQWKTPAGAATGLPHRSRLRTEPVDLWKWLAFVGLGCLLAEWFLFGRQRRAKRIAVPSRKAAQPERELVSR